MNALPEQIKGSSQTQGQFIDLEGKRFYKISAVDQMPWFFISLVSSSDHWLFVSSNGGLTAGRVSPDTALFPYVTVDKIHDSPLHTGCRTLVRCSDAEADAHWEPFNYEQIGQYKLQRNLYKHVLGKIGRAHV